MCFHSRDKEYQATKDMSSLGKVSQVKVDRSQASRDNGIQCTGSRGRDRDDRDSRGRDKDSRGRDRDRRSRDGRDSRDRDRGRQIHLPGNSCTVGTRKPASRESRRVGSSTFRRVFIR